MKKIISTLVLLFGVVQVEAQVLKMECGYVKPIEQVFLSYHLKVPGSDELHQRVIDQYIKNLDPTKMYLLTEDVQKIKAQAKTLFDKIQNKDCSMLFENQKLLQARVKERADFAKKYLGKGFKFDPKVEFVFDPQKKPFGANQKDAEDFLAKFIQFQISNYLATDMKLAEAKTNVIKGWDRNVKRVADSRPEDVYASYLDAVGTALDPHTSYMSRDTNEDFRIQMGLTLQGIGATLSSQDGFTVVEALVPGGAADKSGKVIPQDKILAVGQGESGKMETVIEMELRDVVRKIRGPKGSKVRLLILRKSAEGTSRAEILLVRDEIKLEDDAAKLTLIDQKDKDGVAHKLGVVSLPSFYADNKRGGRSSAADMKRVIAEARKAGVEGIVLDLSGNGGGVLDDAVKIAGLFFATGNVVKQSGRDEGSKPIILRDTDPTVDWGGPLVVLTSRISASASEIVAGTLKDYKRAVIVGGDHTFGKGTVQQVVDIPPGNASLGAAKITVGMFFTPGGFSTQHRGVEGDVIFPSPFQLDDIGEKSLDHSFPPKKIDAFLSPEAKGKDAFVEIQPAWIDKLKQASKMRVEKDPEFKKIAEELQKSQARGKIIRVGDAVKDKEKKDKARALRAATKAEKEKEYLKRPEVQESLNVLMDLIQLEGKKTEIAAQSR